MDAKQPDKAAQPSAPASDAAKSIPKDASMTDAKRNNAWDDDEEEEGMVKLDEEGQIDEDGANPQVSQSRPTNDARPVSLADRLTPLSDPTSKQAGSSSAPSSSANNGYTSPRHSNMDRERERDRYHETSLGPSSSYAPSRSRFGYPSESNASYGGSPTHPYPPSHRESLRPEPFAAGNRQNSFSGSSSRPENRRGWYPQSTPARGSDTYRPGASRDRERERDWDSFRDGDRERDRDRDRERGGLDRDRERDSYRDVVDKRRDWPQRDRNSGLSNYDIPDNHSSYSAAAGGKYGFDNRDFAGRRPTSPPVWGDFDAERSRERDRAADRDSRTRAPSSGWGSGMRQWGKPSDASWEARSSRRPASEDARSDGSHRRAGSRSNNTPPPTTSSETGARHAGSDNASERSEVRSRDRSPHPSRSAERNPTVKGAADGAASKSEADSIVTEALQQDPPKDEVAAQEKPQDGMQESAQGSIPQAEDGTEARTEAMDVEQVQDTGRELAKEEPVVKVEAAAESSVIESAAPVEKANDNEAAEQQKEDSEPSQETTTDARMEKAAAANDNEDKAEETQRLAESAAEQGVPPSAVKTEPSAELPLPAQPETTTSSAGEQSPHPTEEPAASQEAEAKAKSPVPPPESAERDAVEPVEGSSTSLVVEKSQPNEVTAESKDTTESDAALESSDAKQADSTAMVEEAMPSVPEEAAVVEAGTAADDSQPVTAEPEADLGDQAAVASKDGATDATGPKEAAIEEGPVTQAADLEASAASSTGLDPATISNSVDDVDMPDAAPVPIQTTEEAKVMPQETKAETVSSSTSASTLAVEAVEAVEKAERTQEAIGTGPDEVVDSATTDKHEAAPFEMEQGKPEAAVQNDAAPEAVVLASTAPMQEASTEAVQEASMATAPIEEMIVPPTEAPTDDPKVSQAGPVELSALPADKTVKTEDEAAAAPSSSIAVVEPPVEPEQPDVSTDGVEPQEPVAQVEETDVAAPTAVDAATEPSIAPAVPSQIEVSGPYVTATIDEENQTREIKLPQVDYGDDKEAQKLVEQEDARIEEVEMPAVDQEGPVLRIAENDDPAVQVEPPLMTPTTKEQMERAIELAIRQHIAGAPAERDDWKKILQENQRLAQKTTMDVLKAKIHGIPQIVSSGRPLWLDEEDKETQRVKARLFDQLTERKKRLNDKIEGLKKRYRSINQDWKAHCSRLDRIAERREMARRPPVNTPAGTPGGFGAEDPSQGGTGGGLLGASLSTGRANRRSAQTGFAGFGDAVRSEAEFLEILASLENADMQDPNMRAARTTATAPDMYIDPDSDNLMKLRYDDINGYIADPLAFYLDEFDPDVWSEEEKAIFARRYALWPKQFGKIAQALPHKTPSQCVRYYYLNKKLPGNDFKALAAARNKERKRKARVKPKKAKGSALMADLKLAKGEEVDDVEDGSGLRSPMDPTDPSMTMTDAPVAANGRRGGRARMAPVSVDGTPGSGTDDVPTGRKRAAEQGDSEIPTADGKSSDKKRSGPKSKRAKSDSASATEKSRKSKTGGKKDSALVEEPSATAGAKQKTHDLIGAVDGTVPVAASAEAKPRLEDSDLAAAEALGALAGLFDGADANATGAASGLAHGSEHQMSNDGKVGKKRRSKTAAPGEEGGDATGKGRGKQPTSSYWSVAERSEFLRALVVHGPRWEVVSSTLAQKSTAQARNYFARNEDEVDFAEAAALALKHADLTLAEREAAALAFVRQRFASNAATGGAPHLPQVGGAASSQAAQMSGFESYPGAPAGGPTRTTHLPPPPGIHPGQAEMADVKMREESPEPVVQRRGLQINSLLNDNDDAASARAKRRSSLHDWQGERDEHAPSGYGRDASVPPLLYARQTAELDRRPATADRMEVARPMTSEGRSMRDDREKRLRAYDRLEVHRPAAEAREMREEGGETRSWMYDSPYEAHRRPSPTPGYAPMAPPSHPAERGLPASRYSMPPSSASGPEHLSRSVPPITTHLHAGEDAEMERGGYGMYGGARPREHDSHSMPPSVPGEHRRPPSSEPSPTGASFGAAHGYSRYGPPGVTSMYPSASAATTALASRGRSSNGPLTAPLPSSSDRPAAYEQRWQRYSQSPGPSASPASASSVGHGSGFSTASAYRSSNSPYSSFPSQSLPRPSLPSLAGGAGKVGAPHLPSLDAAGRSLPPILGTFPAPGRGLGAGAAARAAGTGEEARYWPYPHRPPRGHDQPPSRNQE